MDRQIDEQQRAVKINLAVFNYLKLILEYLTIVFLCLMQATFKGWMDIMKHAIDSYEVSLKIVPKFLMHHPAYQQ